MATYKTPDVYVEEISKLPASVAQVETAIPAFIGYTERNTFAGKSYENKPTKITSLVEFEEIYGGAPPIAPTVTLNSVTNAVEEVDLGSNTFYLYDSLRLFFDNGGGKCYIVSVGTYAGSIGIGEILVGLNALKREDEPTMLISPDAATLSPTDLASFQQQALKQAAELMDRIVVMDLNNSGDHDADVQNFRDKVGINSLKYGAAYTPWLNTAYPKVVKYRSLTLKKGSSTLSFRNLTKDAGIRDYIDNLLAPSVAAVSGITTAITDKALLKGAEDSIQSNFIALVEAVEDAIVSNNGQDMSDAITPLLKLNHDILDAIKIYFEGLPDPGADPSATKYSFKLKTDLDVLGTDNDLRTLGQKHADVVSSLKTNDVWSDNAFNIDPTANSFGTTAFKNRIELIFKNPALTINANGEPAVIAAYKALNSDVAVTENALEAAKEIYTALINWLNDITNAAMSYEETFDAGLSEISGAYKSILAEVGKALNDCPPSGAIAGIMALVDETRGVWKAPANVSISSVINPIVPINSKEQEDLNVDVNAGKSVNAIRSFTGKGTLVWGARTLAGNDNEWRYVSVRRFYNMVEESVKKSTFWAVFEPNDANTWVRVRAMIENYLTTLWRQGALAGAAPQDAFFVNVGLGTTMTSLDILEGRMNVEIGMAVVRPAEFIILKFSHKLQEA
ncbi:MAG TPA: phage tail protein [Cytophagales bacterium]|nr:phage tail protein [Cytophagales bacterium]HAP59797.1 phage tail protein [Cytophagales bacterium]